MVVPHLDSRLRPHKVSEVEPSVEAKIHSAPGAHTKDAVMASKQPNLLQATT